MSDGRMRKNESKLCRAVVGISAPIVVAAGAWYLYRYGNPAPCLMYLVSGLFCPGCGSGRAARALLHLDVAAALGYNVFFVLILPFCAYYLLKQYVRYVFGKDLLPFFRIGSKTAWMLLAAVVVYTVLRNLPFEPFVFLAP